MKKKNNCLLICVIVMKRIEEDTMEVGCCGNKLMVRLSLGDKLMPSIRQGAE